MKTSRLWLIDLMRIISIIPIITLHLYEILFSSDQTINSHVGILNSFFEIFVRSLSFSGFTIVFTFFFLSGYRLKHASIQKTLIVIAGALTLSLLIGLIWYDQVLLEWDVYYFFILCFLVLFFIGKHLAGSRLETLLFFILSMLPYEYFFPLTSLSAKAVIYGNCATNESMWPVLPSIFFVLYAFTLGKLCRKNPLFSSPKAGTLSLISGVFGLVFVAYSYFYQITPGPGFGCYSHKLPFFYWFILVLSLSLIFISASTDIINNHSKNKIPALISNLSWNKHFGFCYLLQWALLVAIAPFDFIIYNNPGYFFILPIAIFFITEITISLGGKYWR